MVSWFWEFWKRACPTIVLGCLLCGVMLAQSVETAYVPGVNFSRYHTYRWVASHHQYPNPTVDAQIRESIDTQLAARAFEKTDRPADLNVDYQIAISQQETWEVYEDWTKTGLMEQRLPQRRQAIIDVGTLVLDVYDTAAKQLVWQGRASKTLDRDSSVQDRQKNLDKAAKELLANFPPK
jgi:hypothetical protein